MSPICLTSKPNAMRIPNYLGMLIGGYQNFVEQLVLNRWRHHCDVTDMLLKKWRHFFDGVTGSVNFIRWVFFLYWIIKCLSLINYATLCCFFDVIWVEFWPKNAQISQNDFGKLQKSGNFSLPQQLQIFWSYLWCFLTRSQVDLK